MNVDPDVLQTGLAYEYASDDPVNSSDRNGLKSCAQNGNCDTFENVPSSSACQQSWATLIPGQGQSIGFPINWFDIASDAATGYAIGLAKRASALGTALRGGSSYAGSELRAAGETADMWAPLADAAMPFAGAITFGTDMANGEGVVQSASNSAGVIAGGYGGAAIGGLACGALTVATDGVGSIACGFLTGATAAVGGVIGGVVEGLVGDGISDLASWL